MRVKMAKIKFAAEARGDYRKEFIRAAVQTSDSLEIGLHFGDKHSHYDVTGLVRNRHLPVNGAICWVKQILSLSKKRSQWTQDMIRVLIHL